MSVRKFRPRPTSALVVAPVVVTDRSAPAVVGLDARDFRALVAKLRVRHVTKGRRLVVLVSDLAEALEREGVSDLAAEDAAKADDAPASVDSLLARIGRTRATRTA